MCYSYNKDEIYASLSTTLLIHISFNPITVLQSTSLFLVGILYLFVFKCTSLLNFIVDWFSKKKKIIVFVNRFSEVLAAAFKMA